MRRYGLLTLAALVGGAGVLWAASPVPSAKAPAIPQRIVSINLCADQLVLALADRGQIAGLTKNATDPEMSGEAAKRSEEHTSELQSLMRISYAVVCLKKKKKVIHKYNFNHTSTNK